MAGDSLKRLEVVMDEGGGAVTSYGLLLLLMLFKFVLKLKSQSMCIRVALESS